MPDNRSAGMLEDFAMAMVPADDPLKSLAAGAVRDVLTRVPERDADGRRQRFKDRHEAKARLRTWYAWQHNASLRPRFAQITEILPEPDSSMAAFEAWLREIFEAPLAPL